MAIQRTTTQSYPGTAFACWKQALAEKKFTAWLVVSVLYLVAMVLFLNRFLPFINRRSGIVLKDPLLKWLPAADLSIWIFTVIYLSILVTLAYLVNKPHLLLEGLVTMAIMYSVRVLTLYFVPLDPPAGYVRLSDPFILHFAYGGVPISRDLFFSGHTACMFILLLVVRKPLLKLFLAITLIAVMVMLLFQHVHYSIDIAGALIITPACWLLSKLLLRRMTVRRSSAPPVKMQPSDKDRNQKTGPFETGQLNQNHMKRI
ncbi:MAG TPA: phosphatase PAP2-related protein [Chitinophagaceae bacterium]|nr:phosphatase PAP2-related protein [Chitinophagaceae bacterium]